MLLVDKNAIKSGILTTKSRFWGSENLQAGDQLERQSGAKCNRQAQKLTKSEMDLVDFRV